MGLISLFSHRYYLLTSNKYRIKTLQEKEKQRLLRLPRYQIGYSNLLGSNIKFTDGTSFFYTVNEIFHKGIYQFENHGKPYIIDAGANIGLSIMYFKKMYPDAIIDAFEPDKNVFEVLVRNINELQYLNVTLINKAVWNSETTMTFISEGADAGRLHGESLKPEQNVAAVNVAAVRLRPYLERQVDFLKIDIEGAEIVVLKDCLDLLMNVRNLFVEFHSFVNKPQLLSELLMILENAGFRYYVESGGLKSKKPFVERNTYLGMDLLLNIFAYRVEA